MRRWQLFLIDVVLAGMARGNVLRNGGDTNIANLVAVLLFVGLGVLVFGLPMRREVAVREEVAGRQGVVRCLCGAHVVVEVDQGARKKCVRCGSIVGFVPDRDGDLHVIVWANIEMLQAKGMYHYTEPEFQGYEEKQA